MWTSDITHALIRFEEQFGDDSTICIEDIEIGMFGRLIIRYDNHPYVFIAKEDEWFRRED